MEDMFINQYNIAMLILDLKSHNPSNISNCLLKITITELNPPKTHNPSNTFDYLLKTTMTKLNPLKTHKPSSNLLQDDNQLTKSKLFQD